MKSQTSVLWKSVVGIGAMRCPSVGWQPLTMVCAYREAVTQESTWHSIIPTSCQARCGAKQHRCSWAGRQAVFSQLNLYLAKKLLDLLHLLTALSFPKWSQKMGILRRCQWVRRGCVVALCAQKHLRLHPVAHWKEMGSCQLLQDCFQILKEIIYFFKDSIYLLFREGGKEGEREGEKHQCVIASHSPYWGSGLQHRHVPWLRMESVTLWFIGAGTQSTEPHQPGLKEIILKY